MTATPSPPVRPRNVLLNLCLDASGSMSSLAPATVEGVNELLKQQKKGPGQVLLSCTLFNTDFDVRYVARDLSEIPPLGSRGNPYTPHGGTALYDAVVASIHGAEAWLKAHSDFAGDVIMWIQTDGEENSSRIATLDDVNNLIAAKIQQGWEFVFHGTGRAAWTEAARFTSIPDSAKFAGAADSRAHAAAFTTTSRALTSKRMTGARLDESLRHQGMPDAQA